jgi:hypothetical protein
MNKKTDNEGSTEEFQEIFILLKKALTIYISEGRERIIENEEYRLYKQQYPFDEYYYFEEKFNSEWE